MQTKKCTRCGKEKDITEFHKSKGGKYGVHSWCKSCFVIYTANYRHKHLKQVRERTARWKLNNPDKIKQYRIEHIKEMDQWRKDNNDRLIQNVEKWKSNNPDKVTEIRNKYRHNNPEKIKAHSILNNAIRAGLIQRLPCSICGSTKRIHGHHPCYSKPLDVVWLCPLHHAEHHKAVHKAR